MAASAADVVVVGAGLVGLAIGWNLARAGRRVLVAERDRIACGTTDASFAWLNATSKLEPDYHRLNAEGLARHLEFARLWGEGTVGLHGAGTVTWSEPGAAIPPEAMRRDRDALRELGYPCVALGRDDLVALEPHVTFGPQAEGFLAPRDRWLDAPVLARHLAGEIVRAGGEVRAAAPVTAIGRGTATVGGEPVEFGTLVIAAGPATDEVVALARHEAPHHFPVGRVPGLLVTLPRDPGHTWVNHIVYAPDTGNFHIRPTADGGLMLGDDVVDQMIGDGGDAAALADATRALLDLARQHLPRLPVDRLAGRARAVVGVRPMPGDGRTIVGPLPDVPRVYVAVTHSGITLAPVLGELLAREIVEGEVSPLLASFRPDRFGT